MYKKDLNLEQVNETLRQANRIPFFRIFPDNVNRIIETER